MHKHNSIHSVINNATVTITMATTRTHCIRLLRAPFLKSVQLHVRRHINWGHATYSRHAGECGQNSRRIRRLFWLASM